MPETKRGAGPAATWPSPRSPATGAAGEPDEAELVARAQCDPRAFEPLYARYFDPVYRYCYHRLGSWEAAEDAASLVFARALAALPRYRHDASFRSWLFTIAHNVVANVHRDRRLDRSLAGAVEVADAAPTPEDLALRSEAHRTVQALLRQLPDDQRRLLELRLAGLSDAEIARVVGRSHGAVRVAQHRAVTRLRTLLGVGPRGDAEAGKGASDA